MQTDLETPSLLYFLTFVFCEMETGRRGFTKGECALEYYPTNK